MHGEDGSTAGVAGRTSSARVGWCFRQGRGEDGATTGVRALDVLVHAGLPV